MTEVVFPIKPLDSLDSLKGYMALERNKNIETVQTEEIHGTENKMVKPERNSSMRNNRGNQDKQDKQDKQYKPDKQGIFSPRETDGLFWCFYILLNDLSTYMDNRAKSFSIEHDFKIQAIEKMRDSDFKASMKAHRLRLSTVEDELANSKKITASTVKALALLYNECFCIVNVAKRTYFVAGSNDRLSSAKIIYYADDKFYIKTLTSNANKASIEMTPDLSTITNEYYLLESLEKPIKSITSYTALELQTIAKKLDIDIKIENKHKDKDKNANKSKTKQQLYTEILERL